MSTRKPEAHIMLTMADDHLSFRDRASQGSLRALVSAYCERFGLTIKSWWGNHDSGERGVTFNESVPEDKADEAYTFADSFVYSVEAQEMDDLRKAITRFRDEIWHHPGGVDVFDPQGTHDWNSLAMGFLLACGVHPKYLTWGLLSNLSCGRFDEYLTKETTR
jgi:hypothetical protein